MEQSELAEAPRSVVLDLLRRSHLHQNLAVVLGPVGRALDRVTRPFGLAEYPATSPVRRKTEDLVFWVIVGGLLASWPTPWCSSSEQASSGRRSPKPGAVCRGSGGVVGRIRPAPAGSA